MNVDVDLALLRSSFAQLAQTPFFRPVLSDVARYFVDVIDYANAGQYQEEIRRPLAQRLWIINKYLSGSATGEMPYEIEYCLSRALGDWLTEGLIVTTLNPDQEFHFLPSDTIGYIQDALAPKTPRPIKARLAPMSVPRMYRNHPVYCAPLYHELGHFIDSVYGIAELSLIRDTSRDLVSYAQARRDLLHRSEHFCDLFAAQYVGLVSSQVLSELASSRSESHTHPATDDRIQLIETFLGGGEDPRIDLLNRALAEMQLPELKVRYAPVPVDLAFDDVRPVRLGSEAELHGLFPAAWSYLEGVRRGENPAWSGRPNMSYAEKNAVINGLVEKSIRNFAIIQAWPG